MNNSEMDLRVERNCLHFLFNCQRHFLGLLQRSVPKETRDQEMKQRKKAGKKKRKKDRGNEVKTAREVRRKQKQTKKPRCFLLRF